jgi:hypothetical protein
MSLMSPRFKTSSKLINAAAGMPIRMGAKGRAVHLVQMALIDLGYAMPRSTTNPNYSPDGDFGSETREKLIAFQNANNITPSGIIDRNTMLALDHFCRAYKHRVGLNFRSISLTNVPFSQSLADTERIYGQYGIKIEFSSGMSLMMSEEEEQTFNQVDGECNWLINDGEYNQLHSMGGFAPSNEVLVYYVRRFSDQNLLGCGGHAQNRPACTVAATASRWDTAHELGHVLLTSVFAPVHINDRRNLMHPTASTFSSIPVLTDRQITKIRQSVCCRTI